MVLGSGPSLLLKGTEDYFRAEAGLSRFGANRPALRGEEAFALEGMAVRRQEAVPILGEIEGAPPRLIG